jgi:hypothetical protein
MFYGNVADELRMWFFFFFFFFRFFSALPSSFCLYLFFPSPFEVELILSSFFFLFFSFSFKLLLNKFRTWNKQDCGFFFFSSEDLIGWSYIGKGIKLGISDIFIFCSPTLLLTTFSSESLFPPATSSEKQSNKQHLKKNLDCLSLASANFL